MAKLKIICRFCSAPLPFVEGNNFSTCEYCGKNQPIVDTETADKPASDKSESASNQTPTKSQAGPDEKINVVVSNENTQHNWGCLGFFIGLAILILVIFSLVKCSGKPSSNNPNEYQQTTRQPRRTAPSNDYDQPPPRRQQPRVYSNGMPNVRTIPD